MTNLTVTRGHTAEITATTYNAAADHFDEPALGFWDHCGQRTVELAAPPLGATVLDVGCGTGASALPAARAVGPRGHVLGIDLAERLLEHARSKARRSALLNIEFRTGDMTQTGLRDASFDTVISVFSIFFVPDMARQVAELWRLVAPGGRLAITTWGPALFEPARGLFWSAIRRCRPELERQFSPWDEIVDAESLTRLFRAGGTSAPAIHDERATQALARPDDWWTIARGTGYRWTIDELTSDEAEHVRQDNIEQLASSGIDTVATNFICGVAEKPLR